MYQYIYSPTILYSVSIFSLTFFLRRCLLVCCHVLEFSQLLKEDLTALIYTAVCVCHHSSLFSFNVTAESN